MAKVLFVKANCRPIEQSVSVKLYHAFLDSYKETHPQDEIVELDLFKENLPYYDTDKINGMYKLANGYELTNEEKAATDLVNKYLDQFISADKVVIAFPLWNFTVPAVLHTYIDYLCQSGKTFRYSKEGPIGLLSDKKVQLLHARGSVYPPGSGEAAVSFLTGILSFWGVKDVNTVIVEGHNQFSDRAEQIIQEGLEKAASAANQF